MTPPEGLTPYQYAVYLWMVGGDGSGRWRRTTPWRPLRRTHGRGSAQDLADSIADERAAVLRVPLRVAVWADGADERDEPGAVAERGARVVSGQRQAVGFTPVDLARIRHAVEDQAGGWFHNPVFNFGREDAVRYVAEGASLRGLVDRYGLAAVWEAVAAHVEAHPQVLDTAYTPTQIEERRQARREAARGLSREALAAFKARELARAAELIDRAELVDPDADDWERIRRHIRALRDSYGL